MITVYRHSDGRLMWAPRVVVVGLKGRSVFYRAPRLGGISSISYSNFLDAFANMKPGAAAVVHDEAGEITIPQRDDWSIEKVGNSFYILAGEPACQNASA